MNNSNNNLSRRKSLIIPTTPLKKKVTIIAQLPPIMQNSNVSTYRDEQDDQCNNGNA